MTEKPYHYMLLNKQPIKCDLLTWARWIETASRIVARTKIGDVLVSTIFLGLDHNLVDGPPLIFETVIFGGEFDEKLDRYSTWEEAELGHRKYVEMVEASLKAPRGN